MGVSEIIYVTEFKNQFDEWQLLHATRSKEKAHKDAGASGRVIEVVEKSALDIAVAALKKIHEEDKNPYNHNINGPEKCAICIAKEALKTLGV